MAEEFDIDKAKERFAEILRRSGELQARIESDKAELVRLDHEANRLERQARGDKPHPYA